MSQDMKEPKKKLVEQVKASLRVLTLQDSAFWRNFSFLAALSLLFGWAGFPILSFYAVEVFRLAGSPLSASHTACVTRYINI